MNDRKQKKQAKAADKTMARQLTQTGQTVTQILRQPRKVQAAAQTTETGTETGGMQMATTDWSDFSDLKKEAEAESGVNAIKAGKQEVKLYFGYVDKDGQKHRVADAQKAALGSIDAGDRGQIMAQFLVFDKASGAFLRPASKADREAAGIK